jgi:hypothetical protein
VRATFLLAAAVDFTMAAGAASSDAWLPHPAVSRLTP